MSTPYLRQCSALAASLPSGSLWAHHAFTPVYDGSTTISRAGTVKEFGLINPHSMMTLQTSDDSGKPVTWTVEFVGRLNLVAAGWDEESLKPGDRITLKRLTAGSEKPAPTKPQSSSERAAKRRTNHERIDREFMNH